MLEKVDRPRSRRRGLDLSKKSAYVLSGGKSDRMRSDGLHKVRESVFLPTIKWNTQRNDTRKGTLISLNTSLNNRISFLAFLYE